MTAGSKRQMQIIKKIPSLGATLDSTWTKIAVKREEKSYFGCLETGSVVGSFVMVFVAGVGGVVVAFTAGRKVFLCARHK